MSRLGFMWANLFRRPVRTWLTLVSVMIAFLLFVLLRTVSHSFSEGGGFGEPGIDRLMVSPKYSIIDPLPISALQQIAGVDGVLAVTHGDWFGGVYQDRANFFPKYPVKPIPHFEMYSEYLIDPQHLEAFANTRTGAVAPLAMAVKYGWKVGDKIPIEGDIWAKKDGSRNWEFDLVGTYAAPEDQQQPGVFLLNYAYFDEARDFGEGTVGWFTVRIADTERAAEIANAIDALFTNSLNPTRTITEAEQARQFMQQIGDIGLMMTGILAAVFFTILLLTGNTMAQALRERGPELAVLKTIGFTDGAVATLVLGEALLLCAVGALLGTGFAFGAAAVIGPGIEEAIGVFEVRGLTVASALGLSALLGLVVGAVPALTARRLSIVDALRER